MKSEFLRQRYDYELERKDRLTDALNLPAGILGGLGGLLALMAQSFTYHDTVLTWLFVPSLMLAGGAFVACLVQLARTYHRQTYMYLPLLQEMRDWENDFAGLHSYDAAMGKAEDAFEKHIGERIIEAADRNTANNDERSRLLFWARIALFGTLSFTALAGFFFVIDQVRNFNASPKRTATGTASSAKYGADETVAVSVQPGNPRG